MNNDKFNSLKKGFLHKQLKVPLSYTFTLKELQHIKKIPVGFLFKFKGHDFKKTILLNERVNFAINYGFN